MTNPNRLRGRVLVVAGSDSSGGAGIQADIKTITAFGAYAMTAITALTAQSTEGVFGIVAVAPDFVGQQMKLALGDIGADCIKLGMLHSAAAIDAVADALEQGAEGIPTVIDPVMVAKGGSRLLEPQAIERFKQRLLPGATLVTPNIPEAEALTGLILNSLDLRRTAARRLLDMGAQAVLLKGGHAQDDPVIDLLVTPTVVQSFASPRLRTGQTHGTGCTLASAIAALLAQRQPLDRAVALARSYVHEAIRTAPGFGRGHGPLNHLARIPTAITL